MNQLQAHHYRSLLYDEGLRGIRMIRSTPDKTGKVSYSLLVPDEQLEFRDEFTVERYLDGLEVSRLREKYKYLFNK